MSEVSPLLVGYAARDVTPAVGTRLSGFAARTEPAVGVHDPLSARAVAFGHGRSSVVAVVVDVIGVDASLAADVVAGVRARSPVPPDDVVVAATHTHGGPAVLRDAFLGDVSEEARARVVAGAVEAALGALRDLAPAELSYAVGSEPHVARNRRVPGGPIDPRVPALLARRQGRRDVALVGYACHPVVLGPDNLLVTRDYPGFLVDALEASLPGTDAVFLGGCSGQVNTGHSAEASLELTSTPRRSFAAAQRVGEAVAAAAVAALEGDARAVAFGPVRAARTVALLPFVPPATDPSEDRARWLAELDGDPPPSPARRGWLEACRAWADRFPRPEGGVTAVDVVCWALGDLRVAWFPGEVFVEQALELAAAVPETVVCVSNANAAPGYVPHPSAYAAGGYEVEEAFRFYGAPGPFTPDASRRLGAAMLGLLAELRR